MKKGRPRNSCAPWSPRRTSTRSKGVVQLDQLRASAADPPFGSAGLGKTKLASLVAKELDGRAHVASAPLLSSLPALVDILSDLRHESHDDRWASTWQQGAPFDNLPGLAPSTA